MFRVALLGHSQIPRRLDHHIEGVEVTIFRAPGGKVTNFLKDNRLNRILNFEHDLAIIWLGSNDLEYGGTSRLTVDSLISVANLVEEQCHSRVILVELENRKYPPYNERIPEGDYMRLKRAVNKKIQKHRFKYIHFRTSQFELDVDGVHFTEDAQGLVREKLIKVIKEEKDRISTPLLTVQSPTVEVADESELGAVGGVSKEVKERMKGESESEVIRAGASRR